MGQPGVTWHRKVPPSGLALRERQHPAMGNGSINTPPQQQSPCYQSMLTIRLLPPVFDAVFIWRSRGYRRVGRQLLWTQGWCWWAATPKTDHGVIDAILRGWQPLKLPILVFLHCVLVCLGLRRLRGIHRSWPDSGRMRFRTQRSAWPVCRYSSCVSLRSLFFQSLHVQRADRTSLHPCCH